MIVRIKMLNQLKLHLWFLVCLQTAIFPRHPIVSANNPKFVGLDDDGIIETSVKIGQAQYEMINRDASMPR